ncbi:hypothetical protein FUAX_54190 (plasmid) [Fulvitalea axinellae]|uniref:Uncharacterized protein n=1 Tax=Fulvitalea axinellae TaxID=1182444 RepID=A0AAU9CZ02_9BACT|nr:hypothetical protein FUAX_54190 [Fulvitalea axinellae]
MLNGKSGAPKHAGFFAFDGFHFNKDFPRKEEKKREKKEKKGAFTFGRGPGLLGATEEWIIAPVFGRSRGVFCSFSFVFRRGGFRYAVF